MAHRASFRQSRTLCTCKSFSPTTFTSACAMYSALDVEIRPGSGLGMFDLGASLWAVLDMLRNLQRVFPQVDIKYEPDSSAITPIILHLRPHLDLLFSGTHQRLHTICLRKLSLPDPPVTLLYGDAVLSSKDEVFRRLHVERTFGPTYQGDDLRYPGVTFSFDDDGLAEGYKAAKAHPEDKKMQEVKRVLVSQKPREEDHGPPAEVAGCPIMAGEVYRAVVKIHDGVTIYFHPPSAPPVHVRIGETTAQDLTIDLGSPLRIHYKDDERMTIHSTSQPRDEVETSYFYNYFQYGLDFLISGTTHVVRKIIIHSNIPGTPLFQRYQRCPWEIEGKPEDDEDDTPPRMHFYENSETISHFLSPREQPPSMPLDRTNEEDALTLPSPTTRLLGFDGVVLEVTEASQVATVMLF